MKHALQFIFGFLLVAGTLVKGVYAQQVTITPVLTMSPNPSPYLSDWQSRRETVTLTATLDRPYNEPVKLMAQISRNGEVVARTNPEKMPTLELHQGQNIFYAEQLVPFNAVDFNNNIDGISQRSGMLPAGNYEICVGFINAGTHQQLSSDCRSFVIIEINPPTLTSPPDGARFSNRQVQTEMIPLNLSSAQPMTLSDLARQELSELVKLRTIDLVTGGSHALYMIDPKITEKDTAEAMQIPIQFIGISGERNQDNVPAISTAQFQWVPPMPIPQGQIQYTLRIVQVLPGQTAEQAFKVGTPIIEKDRISGSSISLSRSESAPMEHISLNYGTAKFVWNVQAKDANGKGVGKNNGWATPKTFEIGDPDFDLLRIKHDSTKAQQFMRESFFDVFGGAFDPVKDSATKLIDSLRSKAMRLLEKVIDVKKIKEIIKLIGDSIKTAKPKPDPVPCPYVEKKLLRTVTGAWRKISTTVRHITVGKRTVAWADVVWERDVFNVFAVSHCTLLKGHAGAHKMGPAVEEKIKYGTFTETISYGPGVPHSPPKPHPTDGLPEE